MSRNSLLSVALSISGSARTFQETYVQFMMRSNLVTPLQAVSSVDIVFVLSIADQPRRYGKLRVELDYIERLRRVTKGMDTFTPRYNQYIVNVTDTNAARKLMECRDRPDRRRSMLCHSDHYVALTHNHVDSFAGMWTKAKLAFTRIKQIEENRGEYFDFVISTRPDLLVFKPIPPNTLLRRRLLAERRDSACVEEELSIAAALRARRRPDHVGGGERGEE